MRRWSATDLSMRVSETEIGSRGYRLQVSSTSETELQFDAEEAVSAVTATLRRLDWGDAVEDAVAAELVDETAVVTIAAGLRRDVAYELSLTWTGTNGAEWTRTLVIECVA